MSARVYPETPPPGGHPAGWIEGIDIADPQRGAVAYANLPAWVKFAWVKFTEGLGGRDPSRDTHSNGLNSTHIVWGPYHFFRHDQGNPAQQARHFRDTVGDKEFALPPAIDVERPYFDASTPWAAKASRARDISAMAADCAHEVERLFGRRCIVYTLEQYWASSPIELDPFALWLSRYRWNGKNRPDGWPESTHNAATRPATPAPWKRWDVWQFAGNDGIVPGVSVPCDRNYFAGNDDDFRTWLSEMGPQTVEPTRDLGNSEADYRLWVATKDLKGK